MEPVFSSDWFTHHIPLWEQYIMPRFRGKPDLQVLEIGSYEGRSACWLLQNVLTHPRSMLTCIDVFSKFSYVPSPADPPESQTLHVDTDAQFEHNIRALGAQNQVRKMKGHSAFLLRTLSPGSFDLIYIDGSHEPRDAMRDIVLSWDLLKKDGMFVMDDYRLDIPVLPLQKPKEAIDAFLSMFAGEYDLIHADLQVIVQKTSIHDPSRAREFSLPKSLLTLNHDHPLD